MHHLGVGIEHRGARILAIADEHTITVIRLDTAEAIASNEINPARTHRRNTQRNPRPMARGLPQRDTRHDSDETDDPTHHTGGE
ncbi:hypothetical protein [Luethyella okanaganae]|uniref:hypothetical protein n=1 Tax=Luethyella okanaganae TaxID=69372 RepID=UPI0036D8B76D